MRLLFCQPTLDRTGSEKSLLQAISGLRQPADYDIHLLAGKNGPMAEEFTPWLEKLWVVDAPKLRRNPAIFWPYLRSYWTVYATIRKIRRQAGASFAYVNTVVFPQAVLGAWLNNLTCIIHVHEVETTYPRIYYRFCIMLAALLATRIICVCNYICNQRGLPFRRRFLAKSTVVPNSSSFQTGPMRRPLTGTTRILSVIPVTERKGVLDLISFAIELQRSGRPFTLRIIGQIADRRLHSALSKELQDTGLSTTVSFCGEVDDLTSEYKDAHIVVHPSHSEGHPRILVEAANFSLPVVTTRAGGSPEIVADGETGFVVAIGDYRAMAERVLQLLEHPALYDRLSANAYRRYQSEFTLLRFASRIRAVIQEVQG
ncbi:MAG: glycosyltransferase family 4 protein [Candidatus Krumholzibacteria bacterium]|nr:glycosyltransferase family 4 protein [Candidatus Krumholzibacteria bacterium]